MRKFTDTGLWTALNSSMTQSPGGFAGCDADFDRFISELQCYCRDENDLAERTRTLNIAASELAAIRRCHLYGAGEKRAYSFDNRPGAGLHRL